MEQVILFYAHPLCCFCSRGGRVLKLIFRLIDIYLKKSDQLHGPQLLPAGSDGLHPEFQNCPGQGLACFTGTGAVGFAETLSTNRDFEAL